MNIRYNSDTDFIQVKVNDQWIDYKRVYAGQYLLFADGTLYDILTAYSYCSSGNNTGANMTITTDSDGILWLTSQHNNDYGKMVSAFFETAIDVTNYNKLIVHLEAKEQDQWTYIGLTTVKQTQYPWAKCVNLTSDLVGTDVELDIANLTGLHYVAFEGYAYGITHGSKVGIRSVTLKT